MTKDKSLKELAPKISHTTLPYKFFVLFLIFVFFDPQHKIPALIPLRLALVIAIITLLARVFTKRSDGISFIPSAPQNVLMISIFVLAYISTYVAIEPEVSSEYISLLFKVIMFYFILISILESRYLLEKFAWTILIFMAVNCAVTFVTSKLGINPNDNGWRMGAYFGDCQSANEFAFWLLCFLPFALKFAEGQPSLFKKAFLYCCIIIFMACILRTRSRMGFLGLILLLLLYLYDRRKDIKKVVTVILIVAVVVANTNYKTWVRMETIQEESASGEIDESSPSRKNKWRQAIKLMRMHPYTGVGIGNFMPAVQRYGLGESEHIVHNTYLEIAVETGIPNMICFILVIILSLRDLRYCQKYFKRKPDFDTLLKITAATNLSLLVVSFCIIFLSEQYSKMVYMFPAISVVLKNLVAQNVKLASSDSN